jgi:hypothetical protein
MQTAQFVESGNAEAGLIAPSYAVAPAMEFVRSTEATSPLTSYGFSLPVEKK